jgi:hypothetical protein
MLAVCLQPPSGLAPGMKRKAVAGQTCVKKPRGGQRPAKWRSVQSWAQPGSLTGGGPTKPRKPARWRCAADLGKEGYESPIEKVTLSTSTSRKWKEISLDPQAALWPTITASLNQVSQTMCQTSSVVLALPLHKQAIPEDPLAVDAGAAHMLKLLATGWGDPHCQAGEHERAGALAAADFDDIDDGPGTASEAVLGPEIALQRLAALGAISKLL